LLLLLLLLLYPLDATAPAQMALMYSIRFSDIRAAAPGRDAPIV